MPLPPTGGRVVSAAYDAAGNRLGAAGVTPGWNVGGHTTTRLQITGTPIAAGSIAVTDTLIFNADINADGTVTFGIDPLSGCKSHNGGAIC